MEHGPMNPAPASHLPIARPSDRRTLRENLLVLYVGGPIDDDVISRPFPAYLRSGVPWAGAITAQKDLSAARWPCPPRTANARSLAGQ
jgi:hypothetical protein